jgi:HSP20 family molecular chaperone IbpA
MTSQTLDLSAVRADRFGRERAIKVFQMAEGVLVGELGNERRVIGIRFGNGEWEFDLYEDFSKVNELQSAFSEGVLTVELPQEEKVRIFNLV